MTEREDDQSPWQGRAEFQRPAAYGLLAGVDPTLGQHVLDIPKAQSKSEIQPNGLADDVRCPRNI